MINDADLIVIIGFAVKIVGLPQFEELHSLVTQWRDDLRHYGPGVINLKLEQLDHAPETAAKLGELLNAILVHISQYHETIPASVLNEQISVGHVGGGIIFYDYKVQFVEEVVKKLQNLILRN